jgi:hypothetical protein
VRLIAGQVGAALAALHQAGVTGGGFGAEDVVLEGPDDQPRAVVDPYSSRRDWGAAPPAGDLRALALVMIEMLAGIHPLPLERAALLPLLPPETPARWRKVIVRPLTPSSWRGFRAVADLLRALPR